MSDIGGRGGSEGADGRGEGSLGFEGLDGNGDGSGRLFVGVTEGEGLPGVSGEVRIGRRILIK